MGPQGNMVPMVSQGGQGQADGTAQGAHGAPWAQLASRPTDCQHRSQLDSSSQGLVTAASGLTACGAELGSSRF